MKLLIFIKLIIYSIFMKRSLQNLTTIKEAENTTQFNISGTSDFDSSNFTKLSDSAFLIDKDLNITINLTSLERSSTIKLTFLDNNNILPLIKKCYNSKSCVILLIALSALLLLALLLVIHKIWFKKKQERLIRESKRTETYKKLINNRYFKTNY